MKYWMKATWLWTKSALADLVVCISCIVVGLAIAIAVSFGLAGVIFFIIQFFSIDDILTFLLFLAIGQLAFVVGVGIVEIFKKIKATKGELEKGDNNGNGSEIDNDEGEG